MDISKLISPDVSIGFFTGWNGFEESTDRSIEINNEIVDTVNNRLMNAFPVFFNTHYYPGDNEEFIPFIGFSIGAIYYYHQVKFGDENFDAFIERKYERVEKLELLYLSHMMKDKGYDEVLKLASMTGDQNVHYHFAGGWKTS